MDKVDELRNKLKEDAKAARTANTLTESDGPPVSATSADIERYAPNLPHQDGHSIQPVPRPGLGVVSVIRAISDPQRKSPDLSGSTAPGDPGKRRTNRRSGEDHGQNRSDGIDVSASPTGSFERSEQISTTARKVGNLETDDPIPPRFFDAEREAAIEKSEAQGTSPARKRGRPPKSRDSGFVPTKQEQLELIEIAKSEERKQRNFFSTSGKVLSKQEAKELAEPLVSALTDELNQLDKLIWQFTGDELQQPIWSDISENEMQNLANALLKLGQKSPAVATVTRASVDISDYVVAGAIVGPRFVQTAQIIRTARRKKASDRPNRPSTLERLRTRRQQTS